MNRTGLQCVTVLHDVMRLAAKSGRAPQAALQIAMLDERLWFEFQNDAALRALVERGVQERLLRIAVTEHCHAGYIWSTSISLSAADGKAGAVTVRRLPAHTLLRSVTLLRPKSDNASATSSAAVPLSVKLLRFPVKCSLASMTLAGAQLCHELLPNREQIVMAASKDERLLVAQNLTTVSQANMLLLSFEMLQTCDEIEQYCTF